MYKKWPSSNSSVQVVSKLVHMLCTNWALAWAHVYISKQFPSLGTLSVTAWTQLVHICEQVSFQVGHSNFYSSVGIHNGAMFLPGTATYAVFEYISFCSCYCYISYHIRYGAELRRNTACIQQHTARLEAKYVTKTGCTLVI